MSASNVSERNGPLSSVTIVANGVGGLVSGSSTVSSRKGRPNVSSAPAGAFSTAAVASQI